MSDIDSDAVSDVRSSYHQDEDKYKEKDLKKYIDRPDIYYLENSSIVFNVY